MKTRSIAAVLTLFAAAAALTQVRETVNVNVIEVPVTVVDSSGNPIRGLTAANFELFDQGKKREITSFDKIDFGATESLNAISPLNPAARRTFLLLFDLGYSSPNALLRAQEAARRFVKESVQLRDLVGVGTIEIDRPFRLVSAFTTDREMIASAINDPARFKSTDPLQIANQTVAFQPPEMNASADTATKGNAAIADAEIREMAQQMKHGNEQFVRQRIQKQVDSLGQLAATLRAVPGRKQVILLSEGFDARYLEGRDARASQEQTNDNEAILHGQSWMVDNDARYGNTASMTMVDRMAQMFRSSDTVLHAIDIQGVRAQNDVVSGAIINSNAGLFAISRPTGGEVFQNSNDLKGNFTRMLHAQEVVYVLGFQAPTVKPGSFHDLKVKLVNVPGGGRLSHRAGYFEAGGETPVERALSNAEVIVNDIPQDDIHVAALAAPFLMQGSGNAQVPVILDLNGPDLMKEAKNNSVATEIFIYAFDPDGVVRDRLYQRLSLDVRKVGDKLRTTGVRYYGTLSLPPGTYAIKSLVRAGDEKRGFARVDVTVPKPNEVAVLPLIPIDESPKWVLVRPNPRFNAPYPFELSGQDFIPSAQVHAPGGKVALIVYGARPEELTWDTTPKTKVLGQAGTGPAKYVLQLDDATAATLDVTVHAKGAAQKTTVAVARN